MISTKKKMLTGLALIALFVLSINLNIVQALPNQIWVGSAVSGVWQSDSEGARIPEGDIEVQIELVPKVLNLESKGSYIVIMTFPNDEKLGEMSGKTVMQKFPTQSLSLDEIKGVESGTEVTFTVQGRLGGADGEIFGGSLEVTYLRERMF